LVVLPDVSVSTMTLVKLLYKKRVGRIGVIKVHCGLVREFDGYWWGGRTVVSSVVNDIHLTLAVARLSQLLDTLHAS